MLGTMSTVCVCVQLALTGSRSSGQVQLSLCMWRGESVTSLALPPPSSSKLNVSLAVNSTSINELCKNQAWSVRYMQSLSLQCEQNASC